MAALFYSQLKHTTCIIVVFYGIVSLVYANSNP